MDGEGLGGGDEILNAPESGLVEAVIDGATDGVLVEAELFGDFGLGDSLLSQRGFDASSGWGLSFGARHVKWCHCDESLLLRERNYATVKMPIGKNILAALTFSGLTRAELANAADVTEASISRYVNDKQEPRAAELHRLALALGVSMEFLLTGTKGEDRRETSSILREEPVSYGGVRANEMDRVQARIDEVIRDLQSLKDEISTKRN